MPRTGAITAKSLTLNLNGTSFTGLFQGSTALPWIASLRSQ